MIVMLGGPTMNLLIYLVLTVVLAEHARHSRTTTRPRRSARSAKCVVPANSTQAAQRTRARRTPTAAPAYGVLQPGDGIVVDRRHPDHELGPGRRRSSSRRPGKPLSIVGRARRRRTAAVGHAGAEPQVRQRHRHEDQGSRLSSASSPQVAQLLPGAAGHRRCRARSATRSAWACDALGSYPSKIASLWGTVFEGKPRDPNGAIGVVGIGRLGGDIAAEQRCSTCRTRSFALISLLASVNLLLFFFNLLPLLPLDGGHVAGALVEAAKRGRARLRERAMAARGAGGASDPDAANRRPPADVRSIVDTAQMLPVMYAVASVLILLTLLVVYADIVKPVTLGG